MLFIIVSRAYTVGIKAFSAPHTPHQPLSCGCTRNWEATEQGKLPPTDPRDIPYHTSSCSVYVSCGRRRMGGIFRVISFVFQVATTREGALLSTSACPPEMAKKFLAFLCFASLCSFCFTYKTIFTSTHEFSH